MKRSTLVLCFARFSAAISAAQQESKYVLEDVFWVPESNTRARHSTLQAPPQPRVEGREIKNSSSSSRSWTCSRYWTSQITGAFLSAAERFGLKKPVHESNLPASEFVNLPTLSEHRLKLLRRQ